ncbi:hypothetical protein [Streptomyces sp. SGAir0957]
MIYATVSPAPAERLPRPVARRRALQLALLLGGLIGLGFLCGGQAHAQEDASHAVRHTVVADTDAGTDSDTGTDSDEGRRGLLGGVLGQDEASSGVVGAVRDTVLRPVLGTVRNTVQNTVQDVTEPVGELLGQVGEVVDGVVPATSSPSPLPLPDGPPALPGLPDAPGGIVPLPAPSEPWTPTTPVHQAEPPASAEPAGSGADATGSAASGASGEPGASAASADEDRAERSGAARGKRHAPGPYALAPVGPTAYGSAGTGVVPRDRADAHPRHSAAVRHAAAPRPAVPGAPAHPDGVPVAGASAGDGGGSRHGDVHAAAFGSRRVPVLLPPGAFVRGTAAPVTDRHRDIPVLPG